MQKDIVTAYQKKVFRAIQIYFYANIIRQFLYMDASGIAMKAVSMRTYRNRDLNSGRKNLTIMSDAMLL